MIKQTIDYLPDEVILLYGKTNTFVSVSSVWEARLLDGNRDNLDDYILINGRSNAKGVSDGIWDNTLGQWESLILAASDLFKNI